jgi:hypothetical protein
MACSTLSPVLLLESTCWCLLLRQVSAFALYLITFSSTRLSRQLPSTLVFFMVVSRIFCVAIFEDLTLLGKWDAVRNKLEESTYLIMCLQETKCEHFDMAFIKKVCSPSFWLFWFCSLDWSFRWPPDTLVCFNILWFGSEKGKILSYCGLPLVTQWWQMDSNQYLWTLCWTG